MAAYHKVEVSLNTNAVEVGIPSPQSVTVTVPTVGPVGPQGPAGPKGDPGEVSGSIAWDNVTDKPSTFAPSSHTHVAADITDFTSEAALYGPVNSVNGETGAVTLTKNEVGYTITNEEIDSTDSALPTLIAASTYYSASRGGIDVGIMLWSETEDSYGHVTLPILAANEIGRVTVRLSLQGAASSVGVKITLANLAATPVWPLSGYDQLGLDTDYTFRWNGNRWELEILSPENTTATALLFRPRYSGELVGWRGLVPPTPTATGSPGQLAYGYQDGADRLYICVGNNIWRRIPIASW